MKAVLISIQPKWCELIASGKKTIEVRKTCPKLEIPFKCYIYESKGKTKYWSQPMPIPYTEGKGKVIGEFVCDEILPVMAFCSEPNAITPHEIPFIGMTDKEVIDYLGNGKEGYGWHISDLKIYDKPKELSEFKKAGFMTEEQWLYALYPNTHCHYEAWAKKFEITRPPQSWCFVEEL